jgi:hypothetical protein
MAYRQADVLVSNTYLIVSPLLLQFCIGTIKDDFLGVINDPGAAV